MAIFALLISLSTISFRPLVRLEQLAPQVVGVSGGGSTAGFAEVVTMAVLMTMIMMMITADSLMTI